MAGRVLIFATIGLFVVVCGGIVVGVAMSDGPGPVASLDDLRDRGILFLDKHHIFLVYDEGEILALSDDAQHIGDRVVFCESSGLFESPAHGEKFDRRGNYFAGPAARGLARYPVRIEGDGVYVALDQPIPGPERGDDRPLEPTGRFCTY